MSGRPVGRHEDDAAGRKGLTRHEIEAAAIDVCAAAPVDHELVAGRRVRGLTKIGVHRERPAVLPHQQPASARIDDEQSPVRQPVDAEPKR